MRRPRVPTIIAVLHRLRPVDVCLAWAVTALLLRGSLGRCSLAPIGCRLPHGHPNHLPPHADTDLDGRLSLHTHRARLSLSVPPGPDAHKGGGHARCVQPAETPLTTEIWPVAESTRWLRATSCISLHIQLLCRRYGCNPISCRICHAVTIGLSSRSRDLVRAALQIAGEKSLQDRPRRGPRCIPAFRNLPHG